jgi:serine/threonine-protein kinase
MMAHSRDPVVPPSELNPGVPADLERVVLCCLAKKPGERYPNVKTLARALSACAAASDWDADKADRWWGAILPPAEIASPGESAEMDSSGTA